LRTDQAALARDPRRFDPAKREAVRYGSRIAARQNGDRPVSDIEEGHISSACCILANLSMELGRSLTWDAAAGRVKNDEEANRRLTRPYRGDWEHPTPENV